MIKRDIRQRMRLLRRAVAPEERKAYAARLCAALLARGEVVRAIGERAPICVYLAVGDEIDLAAFIDAAHARGAVLCAPYWTGTAYGLAQLDGTLRLGPRNIPEPAGEKIVAPHDVGLWIVPGLAFTADGARLGYGGGWYDRFFAASRPDAARLAVAYPFQVLVDLPQEAHDIAITDVVTAPANRPIGFFDSGVGGLSLWQAVVARLPGESTDYVADEAYCPYGARKPEEVRERARRLVRTLLARGAKMVVVACNTATAAAIDDLRKLWPEVPFIGLEPAVKPAAQATRTGIVGVLATAGTFEGRLWRETSGRLQGKVRIVARVAGDFVSLVERGVLSGDEAEGVVRAHLEPLLAAGADHIVLGCTHFSYLKEVMMRIVAGRAVVIDSAQAVARQVEHVLVQSALQAPTGTKGCRIFSTTGNQERFFSFLQNTFSEGDRPFSPWTGAKGQTLHVGDRPFVRAETLWGQTLQEPVGTDPSVPRRARRDRP